jgi:hypothetical protein
VVVIVTAALAIAGAAALATQNPPQNTPADLLILNGKVDTADGSGTFNEAIAVRGNRIAAVGATSNIEKLRGPQTEVVDAGGA